MTPADRDRFEKCLALAAQGATMGERAAARAAAERIARGAGLTFAEAAEALRRTGQESTHRATRPPPPRRAYPWAQPKAPVTPITVEELLRQKAETEAWQKRSAAAADRRRKRERADQDAYVAEQRARQAERDRDWARTRTDPPAAPGDEA
ncbi:hypothetical protein [Methylobacterium sp. 391_Methyba4]|uniref:hypothetical protein n=1 Tax=Methylobacterium sp. 391_Methyba4 TaxID=3038924 RepID=UPI00241F8DCE|nr:hypothetical protein [Methylobacterium sp. 391_Methyba4]WFS07061.1 hypothetical protein P9K36_27465 [Methylobacterium sp. 391_Methyba4]